MKRRLLTIASMLAATLLVWAMPGSTAMAQKSQAAPSSYAVKGKKLFTQYCASCHGTDGRGEGPVAMALKGTPPDLTMLQAPGEKFPFYQVQTKIDGEKATSAHGTSRMPVWGTVLRRTRGELQKEAEIYALVRYIAAIQQHVN
ncbi:MAG TPA: c-type cytochrome [Blastocatellia bacterium]|nr:c-type cytochrome [Blastocatellia bacterium]